MGIRAQQERHEREQAEKTAAIEAARANPHKGLSATTPDPDRFADMDDVAHLQDSIDALLNKIGAIEARLDRLEQSE